MPLLLLATLVFGLLCGCASPAPAASDASEDAAGTGGKAGKKEATAERPAPPARTGKKVEKGPRIEFDDQVFRLVYKDAVDGMLLNEYLPEGETSESWRQMISVRVFEQESDPEKAANGLVAAVSKQNPSARYAMWQSQDGAITGVDFVLTDGKGIAEFNVFVYKALSEGAGVRADQYAMRVYGNRIVPFLESLLQGNREYLIEKVVLYPFPEIVR